jgi:Flp pilus assembly protein TadD
MSNGTQQPLIWFMTVESFDVARLPPACRERASAEFRNAVSEMIRKDFEPFKGNLEILVDQRAIRVTWTPGHDSPTPFAAAIQLLQKGKLREGVPMLEALLGLHPNDAEILLNLGMALSDLGQLERAIEMLRRRTELAPDDPNGWTALGVALQRQGTDAAAPLTRAVELAPQNFDALRNLASWLGKQGRHEEAEKQFRAALALKPSDPGCLYGLGLCVMNQGKSHEAEELFKRVIASDPDGDLAEMARTASRQMAEETFKKHGITGLRMDAVYYCLGALEHYRSMNRPQIQEIAFEIALLGQKGLDVHDPKKTYEIKSMPGKHSGLKLVCYMHVGFKEIAPEANLGFDLSKEYDAALSLFEKKPMK